MGALVACLVMCREWVHATNVTMQRAPMIGFSATSSFGTCAWRSTPLRKISGTVLMTVLSPEESRNILAPLIACDVCPRQLSGLWIAEPVLPKERLQGLFARLVRELMIVYEQYELSSTTNFDVLRAVDTKVALEEAQRWAVDASGSGMVHTVQVGDGSAFWCVYYHSLTPRTR